METKIDMLKDKPFRGITTIQLFDKDTGELVEEHQDENTYNDRLLYINYLNTVLRCRGRNTPNRVSPYGLSLYTNQDNFFQRDMTAFNIASPSGQNYYTPQLFAHLVLTTDTEEENAHGYFNGIPIGIADTNGVNAGITSLTCAGSLNLTESYIGNDRLHLVFDFGTDKCNQSFDALWLFPSNYEYNASTTAESVYRPIFFCHPRHIAAESYTFPTILSHNFLHGYCWINMGYAIATYTNDGYDRMRYTQAVQVINTSTGELEAQYDNGTTRLDLGVPFYYVPDTNELYALYCRSNAYYGLYNNDYFRLKKINLTTGEITNLGPLSEVLDTTYDTYNYASDSSSISSIRISYTPLNLEDGSVILLVRTYGLDKDTLQYTSFARFYSFDPATGTFTHLKTHKLLSNGWSDTRLYLYNGLLYTRLTVTSGTPANNNGTVFDAKTGDVLYTKAMNLPNASGAGLFNEETCVSFSGTTNSDYWVYSGCSDYNIFKQPICGPFVRYYYSFTNSSSVTTAYKRHYMISHWSTHNKLSSKVNKTDMTTMKIQYDIIWDNIKDVIMPQLV